MGVELCVIVTGSSLPLTAVTKFAERISGSIHAESGVCEELLPMPLPHVSDEEILPYLLKEWDSGGELEPAAHM
eukprot:9435667-Karenia_brevis.AAC.1